MKKLLLLLIGALLGSACAPSTPAGPRTLTIMTHDAFAVSDNVRATFESANNVKLQFIKSGDPTPTRRSSSTRVIRPSSPCTTRLKACSLRWTT